MADFGRIPEGERFAMVPAFALTLSEVKPGPKALYASLCANASEKGLLWRSWGRLGQELGVSKRQIQRWIFELERLGLLVRMGWRGSVPHLLVIRDKSGCGWARKFSVKNVVARRMKSATHGRDGALKRWKEEDATPVTSVGDAGVAIPTTPVSPKHYLPNNITLTKERARQERARGAGGASDRRMYGLKRLERNPNADVVQEKLNQLVEDVGGWIMFLELADSERVKLLTAKCGQGVSQKEIKAAVGAPGEI